MLSAAALVLPRLTTAGVMSLVQGGVNFTGRSTPDAFLLGICNGKHTAACLGRKARGSSAPFQHKALAVRARWIVKHILLYLDAVDLNPQQSRWFRHQCDLRQRFCGAGLERQGNVVKMEQVCVTWDLSPPGSVQNSFHWFFFFFFFNKIEALIYFWFIIRI